MEYEILYSKRKTVCITVKDNKVIVKSPIGTAKRRLDELVIKHKGWIEKQLSRQNDQILKDSILNDEQIKALRKKAKLTLTDKTTRFAKNMGLSFGRITITSAKTRFGSCSSKGNIAYSWRLMLYPEEAQDYVVVHELAHLIEMNHSAKFWRIVERYLPDYKSRKIMLKS